MAWFKGGKKAHHPEETDTQPHRDGLFSAIDKGFKSLIGKTTEDPLKAGAVDQLPNTPDSIRRDSGDHVPAIILVGSTGAGKSSVVNMIADWPDPSPSSADKGGSHTDAGAVVGNGASGCTKEPRLYHKVAGNGRRFHLYDTVGLGEGESGTVPSAQAITQLNNLLLRLGSSGGVSFIIFVFAAGRLTQQDESNYALVRLLCGPDVPIILFATRGDGLNVKGEEWLKTAEPSFEKAKFKFTSSVVITASPGLEGRNEKLYNESIANLRTLFTHHVDVEQLYTYKVHPSGIPTQVLTRLRGMVSQLRIGDQGSLKGFHKELMRLLVHAYDMRWGEAIKVAAANAGKVSVAVLGGH